MATEYSHISAKVLSMHEEDEVHEGEERSRKRWRGMGKREGSNDIKGAMLVVVATMVWPACMMVGSSRVVNFLCRLLPLTHHNKCLLTVGGQRFEK